MEQIFAVIIGILFGIGGPLITWSGIRQYMIQSRFEKSGQVTAGIVTIINVLPRGARLMHYEYTVEIDGVAKTFQGSQSAKYSVRQGDTLQIMYLSDKPQISQPNLSGTTYRISAIITVVVGLGMTGGFIYLLPFIFSEF